MGYDILEPETQGKGFTVLEPEQQGPIQKMKRTPRDYWDDVGAAIEPLTPHGLLNQPQRLINLIRQGLGKQPYGELDTTKSLIPHDLFQAHPTPQELATDPTYSWMKGKTPEEISAYGEKLAQEELGQRTLGMAPGPGFFGGPQVPPWMLQPNFGRTVQGPRNVPPPTGLFPNEPVFQGLQRGLAIAGGVARPLNELASGLATTEGAAMLPAFMATGPVAPAARLALASQAALQAPESIAQRAQVAGADPNIQNLASLFVGAPLDVAVPLGMASFHEPVVPKQGIVPSEIRHGSLEMPFQMPNKPGIPVFDRPQPEHTLPIGPSMPWDDMLAAQYRLPDIGQREVRVEQPIIQPGQASLADSLQIEKGVAFKGEPKQGGQISFRGEGIPSAMQSKVIPKGEQSEQAALMQGGFVPATKEGRLQSGINPDDILPAINLAGRLLIGRQGDTHADILERNGLSADAIPHSDPARGFAVNGQFMSRQEAQKASGITGTAKTGGLDSMDLPGAAKTKVLREAGFSDSEIRETMGLRSGLGLDPLKDVGERLKNDLSTIGDLFKRGKITDMVAAKRDAVDNIKLRAQNIAENHVKLAATKLFDKEAEKARDAVFMSLEAQKVGGLQQALTRVQGLNDKAEKAIRFAMDPNNTQKLNQLTDRVRRLDAQNVALANSEGITVEPFDEYMKKMYEKDRSGFFFRGERASGQHQTVFDAIQSGAKPKSLDAVALIGQRTQEIYNKVELKRWLDHFETVLDPTTQEPVVKKLGKNLTTPTGYTRVEGLNVAIKDGYDRVFHAVTGESHISKNLVGQGLLQGEGAVKHGTLAFDIFHLSRIAQFAQSLKLGVGYKKGLSLLEYSARDLQEAVNQGLAPRDAVNYQNETVTVPQGSWTRRQVGQILIQNGLNVGRHSEALYTAFVRAMPGLKQTVGAFNRFVFDKFSRGVLYELGQREFERVAKDYPNLSPQEVARKVSKDLNFRVGNIGRQGVIKSATMQDLTQLAFLAPRWVESMAQSEVRSIGQVAASVGNKGKMGTLGKSSANLLATYIIATQAANYLFNGHSTFQNPNNEGHELDLFVPPLTKGGRGFYVSPLSVVAELQHDLLRYTRNSNKTSAGAIVEAGSRIVGNKLSPPMQGLMELKTGRNWKGEPLEGWDRVKDALITAVNPTPLLARQAVKSTESDDLAPLERQLFATAGIKAEPESFIESRQRLSAGKKLSLAERVEQEKQIAKERPKQTDSEKIASRERAVAGEVYRGQQLKGQMSKADRQWIESRGLNLEGFDNKLHMGKTLVYLTKPEMERLNQYTLDEYNKAMPEVRQKYPQLSDNSKDIYFSERMSAARGKARAKLISELNSKNETNQKKKRFTVFDTE